MHFVLSGVLREAIASTEIPEVREFLASDAEWRRWVEALREALYGPDWREEMSPEEKLAAYNDARDHLALQRAELDQLEARARDVERER